MKALCWWVKPLPRHRAAGLSVQRQQWAWPLNCGRDLLKCLLRALGSQNVWNLFFAKPQYSTTLRRHYPGIRYWVRSTSIHQRAVHTIKGFIMNQETLGVEPMLISPSIIRLYLDRLNKTDNALGRLQPLFKQSVGQSHDIGPSFCHAVVSRWSVGHIWSTILQGAWLPGVLNLQNAEMVRFWYLIRAHCVHGSNSEKWLCTDGVPHLLTWE